MASFTTRVNTHTLKKVHDSHDYVDCFTVLTVSQSPSSAHTYIPRLLHSPVCFTVSTLCIYTDLGSRGYLGIKYCSRFWLIPSKNTYKSVHNICYLIYTKWFICTYVSLYHASMSIYTVYTVWSNIQSVNLVFASIISLGNCLSKHGSWWREMHHFAIVAAYLTLVVLNIF